MGWQLRLAYFVRTDITFQTSTPQFWKGASFPIQIGCELLGLMEDRLLAMPLAYSIMRRLLAMTAVRSPPLVSEIPRS